ncbi:Gustatory receptor 174 [Halyomorpha halys]|nr:Gustatory receptor 174 [Halyomorpha halys]
MPLLFKSFKKILRSFIFCNDVYNFINYSIYPSKLTGFFPLTELGKLVIVYTINFLTYVAVIITCYYFAYTKCINYFSYEWRLSKYMDIAELSIGFTTMILCMISLLRKKYLLIEIFETVSQLENSLFTNNPVEYCHLNFLQQTFFVLSCIILKYNARRILKPNDVMRTGLFLVMLSLDLALVAVHFINRPFIAFLHALKKHFLKLNQLLKNLNIGRGVVWKHQIDIALDIYLKLLKISLVLSELYSNIVLLTIACAYLIILKNAYSACYVYLAFDVDNPRRIYYIVIRTQYIALWFFEIYLMVHYSTQIKKQNMIFNDTLTDLWNQRVDLLSEHKKVEIHLAFKPVIIFKGFEFLSLDYNLVSSVIFTTTTYVVILIKFGAATDNHIP